MFGMDIPWERPDVLFELPGIDLGCPAVLAEGLVDGCPAGEHERMILREGVRTVRSITELLPHGGGLGPCLLRHPHLAVESGEVGAELERADVFGACRPLHCGWRHGGR